MLKKLAQIVIIYVVKDLSEKLKKLSIFILKKKVKKNNLLPGTYKPITVKNILVKLVKKALTIYIVKKVKAKTLLL